MRKGEGQRRRPIRRGGVNFMQMPPFKRPEGRLRRWRLSS
jgi:hypothetical protein